VADTCPAPPDVRTWLGQTVVCDDFLDHLSRVRAQFADIIRLEFPLLLKVSSFLQDQAGRFLRPALVFLSGHFGVPRPPPGVTAATALELAHLASLVHGDVLEDTGAGEPSSRRQLRRGINWGNMFAVMAGNYLLVKSYGLCSGLGYEISQLFSRASADVYTGKMWEVQQASLSCRTEAEYLKIVEKRTAAFYELACRLGAKVSGAPPGVLSLLADYGRNVGMAYQLTSDILDVLAEEEDLLAHPVARALEVGGLSFPLLVSFRDRNGSGPHGIPRRPPAGEVEVRRVLTLLRGNGSLSHTLQQARCYADRARTSLTGLPDLPATRALAALVDFVVGRAGLTTITG
jgi:heptaprenyl diphosphate synthase